MWDIVKAVKEGKALFEWEEITSELGDEKLHISVMRDAIRFNQVPVLKYNKQILSEDRLFDGVRVPATANEMQEIADLLFCTMLTPKVIDLIWQQAHIKFDPVVNLGPGKIVATQNITDVHTAIEGKIKRIHGGYPSRGIIDSVGKYWVITNKLNNKNLTYGVHTCCNYGWHNTSKSGERAVTPGLYVYQGQGTRHNDQHVDPSQVVRLMYRMARLERADGSYERVDLHEIFADTKRSAMVNHDGVLKIFRQPSVEEPKATLINGVWRMPDSVVYSSMPPSEMEEEELKLFLSGLKKSSNS